MLFPFLLIYLASFYVEMLSDKHIFKFNYIFCSQLLYNNFISYEVLVLSAENNWERKLIIVLTYLLIMLIPIFLFGVYDYCIYHSDLIETLNSKGAIHELYDIINQGIKAVSSEHENEKIIFMVLWFSGTLFYSNLYLDISTEEKWWELLGRLKSHKNIDYYI